MDYQTENREKKYDEWICISILVTIAYIYLSIYLIIVIFFNYFFAQTNIKKFAGHANSLSLELNILKIWIFFLTKQIINSIQ